MRKIGARSITDRDNEVFNLYLKDINKYKVMGEEEEKSLYPSLMEKDEKTINKFITSNLRFVVSVAKQYQGQGLDLMDLISEGNDGLIKSVNHFNPEKGTRFITYAGWWIRQSIIDALNTKSRSVRIPNSTLNNMNKLYKIYDFYLKTFNTKPSVDELMDSTGLPEETIKLALCSKRKTISFDMPFEKESDDAGCLLDVIPNNDKDPEEDAIFQESKDLLVKELENIPKRESTIIKMYYGIYTDPMSLVEIGEYMGLTAERVRQIKDVGINLIKRRIKEYE